MLRVCHMRKSFGPIRAVNDVSFQVEPGEVLGFLGPNGAGKTTTMRMITGFLPPSAGTAVIAGHDILEEPVPARAVTGYLPENAPVYADMTVWNYLAFIAAVRGFSGRRQREQVGRTIEQCRLDTVRHRVIGTLSKGYRQRTCLAQALIHDPPLLIMDEPTDGLDPNQKRLVRDMIREMAARKAIVISTHILEEVEAACTRAIIIRDGAIVANGSPAELKDRDPLGGAVELEFAVLPEGLEARLGQLPAAGRIEIQARRVTVYPRDRRQLLAEVLALVKVQSTWQVTGLKPLEGRLDNVFRQLTQPSGEAA